MLKGPLVGVLFEIPILHNYVNFSIVHFPKLKGSYWARYQILELRQGKLCVRHDPKLLKSFTKILGQIMENVRSRARY